MNSGSIEKCSKCGYPSNHPFGIVFFNGVCSGCVTHQEKYERIWTSRYELLKETVAQYSKSQKGYDCVVPVAGDAEDYFLIEKVLELGLSPLVVAVNDYYKNDIGWYNLHHLITYFDVDSIVYNPNFVQYQELVRTSLRKFDHVLLPFLQLHTSFPVHIAKLRKIPLIIWPQNQSVEQVGKFSHLDSVEMSKWSRKEHDLFGVDIEHLIGNGAQVDETLLDYYKYPEISGLKTSGIMGLYLSNYIPWDPLKNNSRMVEHGYKPESNPSTFDTYERAGSSVYYGLHDLLKMKRVGYRKVHDHVAREIRHGRLDKASSINILEKSKLSKCYIRGFFDWLGVTKSGYEWFLRHKLQGFDNLIASVPEEETIFAITDGELSTPVHSGETSVQKFILFGKGV